MTNVNTTPFNTIPNDWAFDAAKGPFIRDLVEQVFQLRARSGGDTDLIGEQTLDIDGLNAAVIVLDARADDLDVQVYSLNTVLQQVSELSQTVKDLEVLSYAR